MTTATARTVRAPRGTSMSCRGWAQEAALRMLMNNLDPEVAERPDELVVYGGTGRAARSWEAFDHIVAAPRTLGDDETLLVQSGKPVGVFRTPLAIVTDQTSAHDPLNGYVPYDLTPEQATELRASDAGEYVRRARASMARQVRGILTLRERGEFTPFVGKLV